METPSGGIPCSRGAEIGALELTLATRRSETEILFKSIPLKDEAAIEQDMSTNLTRVLPSVGSGSWRLSDVLQKKFGVSVEKHREPVCLWSAIEYSLKQPLGSNFGAFTFDYSSAADSVTYPISAPYRDARSMEPIMKDVPYADLENSFPILLVIVKTGTSFYRMDSPTDFVRVGGSSIGSSSIAALGKLLVSEPSVAGMVSKSQELSRPSSVDLLVEDIYGGDCLSIGLPGSIIASCLGKADSSAVNSPDLSKSLLDMISINTAQLTSLHARIHKCKTALIVGPICEQPEVAECIQRVLHILGSRSPAGVLRAVFFRQSNYLGCLGAMLRRETLVRQLSFSRAADVAINTATVEDGVHDETYTKLRISTPPR
jgi:pantothenate kinase